MADKDKKTNSKNFSEYWSVERNGDEKSECQQFWQALLRDLFGITEPEKYIRFENPVMLKHTSFIDGYIKDTKVIIEQKSRGIDLRRAYKQSDGSELTPYEQALRYSIKLGYSNRPRWIITCNFDEFLIYDEETPNSEPTVLKLENLAHEYHKLDFLVDEKVQKIINEVEISTAAGRLVGEIYDALLEQYDDPSDPENLRSLNVLCVRLVFCFYAEDAGVFEGNNLFGKFLEKFKGDLPTMRKMMIELFKHLDTPQDEWDEYDTEFNKFPYVNGGLFDKNLKIKIPPFNDKIADIIINKASYGFDWKDISPTIFGAVFESTLNPETRRSGGMHYTSIDNIHKVIDPLFLNDLNAEFIEIDKYKSGKFLKEKYTALQQKIAALKFFEIKTRYLIQRNVA